MNMSDRRLGAAKERIDELEDILEEVIQNVPKRDWRVVVEQHAEPSFTCADLVVEEGLANLHQSPTKTSPT